MKRRSLCQKGFTLIEIIITIVVAALAGLAAFAFVNGTVGRSSEPVFSTQALALNKVPLEGLTVQYNQYLSGDPDMSWPAFVSALNASGGTVTDVTGALGANFAVYQVTFTGESDQVLSAFFSE